jgi:anti-sigma regulatory factor (Ser/Thr protein kinase)
VTAMSQFDDAFVFTLALKPVPEACPLARRLAEEALGFWGYDAQTVYHGKLVVNELVTNAVRASATGQEISLRIFIGDSGLPIIEVWDDADEMPIKHEPDPMAETGRGVFLVENFTRSWGTNPVAGGGKVVWAELEPIRRQGRSFLEHGP